MKKSYAQVKSHFEVNKLQKSKIQKLIILLFSVFLMTSIFPISDGIAQELSADNWTFHSEVDGVKVYYQFSECGSDEINLNDPLVINTKTQILVLKFENTSLQDVVLSWNTELKANANSISNTLMQSGVFITDCSNSPEIKLTEVQGDNKPISVVEALDFLSIQVSDH